MGKILVTGATGNVGRLVEAIGREARLVELTYDEALAELRLGMGEYAEWYLDGMAQMVDHPQPAETTVAEITGRPGTTFAEWAVKHADEFR